MTELEHPGSKVRRTHGLASRLREAGLVLVQCDLDGAHVGPRRRTEDWLTDLVQNTPIVRTALRAAAAHWVGQEAPGPVEAVPGLWFAPSPVVQRRRRTGYAVAVIPTTPFLESEQLAAMCQSASMDHEICRHFLATLPPASPDDVARLVTLFGHMHADELQRTADAVSIESIGQELAESWEEISLLYTITRNMTVVQRPERFVASACEELLATLPYGWIGTRMVEDASGLNRLAGRLVHAGDPPADEPILDRLMRRLIDELEHDAPCVLAPDTDPDHADFTPLGRAALVHPVVSEGRIIGVLVAARKQGDDAEASSVDMKLLGATATHMGIFLQNAVLFENINATFLGTLEALTASIDAKDRYTCGHSRRVAHLTGALAQATGCSDEVVSRMHITGLVHDIGKIGVPERVLLKIGGLTEEEFGWIRRHPEIGHRILRDIPQLGDVLEGVLHHHERWDGCGYPEGLAGEAIPLSARMIAMADAFDAMTSNRTYRSGLPRPAVLQEIARCAGTQFDPALVPIFVDLDFQEYDRMVAEHQARELRSGAVTGAAA